MDGPEPNRVEDLADIMGVEFTLMHGDVTADHRERWWADFVARTGSAPEGARLVGWESVVVADRGGEARAVAGVGDGRAVGLLSVGEAQDLGFLDEDTDAVTPRVGGYPAVVVGLRWERPTAG